MKFVFTFALILTMLLAAASLSIANSPVDPFATPVVLQPTAGVPSGVDGPGSTPAPQIAPQTTAAPQMTADGWEVLAPGISYQKFHLDGPVNVYVARMDTSGTYSSTIETSLGNGTVVPDWASIPAQAQFYNGALNSWNRSENSSQPSGNTWGMTNKVLVAINGSYFDTKTYEASSGMVTSGWQAKRFDDYNVWRSFTWTYNRSYFISDCLQNVSANQLVKFHSDNSTMQISGVNTARKSNQLILYTPQFDDNTGTNNDGLEVLVEMSSPAMPYVANREITGTVITTSITGSMPIPYDAVVLSANGMAASQLAGKVKPGAVVGITQEITDYKLDCSTSSGNNWSKTYAAISGDFHFLKDGNINPYPDNKGAIYRDSRTAVAYNSQYVYFIVADGDSKQSIGLNIAQLGDFTLNTLQATDGITEDSGGSSIMVVNGVIVNQPSDCRLMFLPSVNNQSNGTNPPAPPGSTPSTVNPAFYSNCIRWVTNGLLMVQSVPKQVSQRGYTPGTDVKTISDAYIRLGPGTNYAPIATAYNGAQGKVQPDPNGLNGVWAKGYFWWKVAFLAGTGWVAENNLQTTP